jgi:hypothetical protein
MGSIDENKRQFKNVEVEITNLEMAYIIFKYKGEVVKKVILSMQEVDITTDPEKRFQNIRFVLADVQSNSSSMITMGD